MYSFTNTPLLERVSGGHVSTLGQTTVRESAGLWEGTIIYTCTCTDICQCDLYTGNCTPVVLFLSVLFILQGCSGHSDDITHGRVLVCVQHASLLTSNYRLQRGV